VPSGMPGVSQSQVDDVRRNQIEPALRAGDWSGAAVAAANGLETSSNNSPNTLAVNWLLVALILAGIVIAVVVLAAAPGDAAPPRWPRHDASTPPT
jgi:hypothetical protein